MNAQHRIAFLLCCAARAALAASLLVSAAASAFTMEWVPVPGGGAGDAGYTGCAPYPSPCGAVAYDFEIGKYEVTNAQYAEFLNAVDPSGANALGLYDAGMAGPLGGIFLNTVNPAGSRYLLDTGRAHLPVNYITWYDALRFANWMHNGMGSGSTETGAYTLLGGTPTPANGAAVTRNAGAQVFLPSEHEWYKAAYYDAVLATWFDYPTGTNVQTACNVPSPYPNEANCKPGGPDDFTDVGSYAGSPSPYGTFDQGGNVFEWNEEDPLGNGSTRGVRGGSALQLYIMDAQAASTDLGISPNFANLPEAPPLLGFRVARVAPAAACADGHDNDGDGGIDFGGDAGCASSADASEAALPASFDIGTFYFRAADNNPPTSGFTSGNVIFEGPLAQLGVGSTAGTFLVTEEGPPVGGEFVSTLYFGVLGIIEGKNFFECPITGCNTGDDILFVAADVVTGGSSPYVPPASVYTLDGSARLVPELEADGSCTTDVPGLHRCLFGRMALNAFPELATGTGSQTSVAFDSSYRTAAALEVPFQASVTFGEVTGAGGTAVAAFTAANLQLHDPDFAPIPPGPPTIFQLETSATFTPGAAADEGVVVCVSYPEPAVALGGECSVRLLYAAGADAFNQDATLDTPYPCPLAGASCGGKCIDTDANRVCGRVAALNPPDWFVPALDLRDDCSNGLDDDGDGNADHPADLGCDAPDDQSEWSNAILCDNGQSDDEDPFVDYPADPGCDSIADPTETSPALVCDDGADNDGDGRYDFSADLGCDSVFDGSELSSTLICDDGLDNDGDGAADHPADLGCFDQADPSERTGYACDDGLDNDGDGYADWPLDPGCFSIYDVDEWAAYGTIECDDAFDNDADGLIDLADPGCISPFDTSEQSETTSVPAGQGVQASLLGGASAVYGIALEFENTPGGDLTVESYVVPAGGTLPGLPPVDFQLGTDPAQYWQLEYTGAFNGGGIELTFHYDDTGLTLAEEEQLRIYHYVGGTWVPHYDLPDTVNDTITVTVTSFSPFVVAYVPQCADTRDNDGDGLADWPADPGCTDGDDPLEIAQSATIHVTTTADDLATNGNCSLREAIRAANLDLAVDACEAGGVADSILLPEGTYPLSLAGAGEDDGLTGDLDVRAALALVGQGAGAVIDASGLGDRVLHVRPSGADVDAVLLNLTLRGGDAGGSDGGGLLVESAGGFHPTTTVEDCAIESNTAASGGGVRIAHPLGGTATLSRTAIRTNTATGTGAGGLDAEGPSVSLLDSAVEGNTAVSGAGGIADRQWLLVRHSTIAGNQSASGPGGIGVSQAYLSLGNATVSGNTTGGAGGGLAAGDASSWAAVDVLFTTIAGNAAAQGGGLQVGAAAQTTFALGASVIAGNTAAADPDVGGAVASGGDNVVGQQGASTGWVASDQVGTVGAPLDAKLGPLATNGGPTRTHALLAASPALDGADCQGVIRDQRNVPRPYGAACDAGALESTPACSDTLDNDGDGLVDEAADPGCFSAASLLENPKCDNDLDDDGDGKVDWNGPGTPDPNCTQPYKDKESGSCGFGAELAFVMPLLAAWARRLRRRSTATGR